MIVQFFESVDNRADSDVPVSSSAYRCLATSVNCWGTTRIEGLGGIVDTPLVKGPDDGCVGDG